MGHECAKPFCTSGWCAIFKRCLFNGEPFACAGGCEITWPHYHEAHTAPDGNTVPAIIYIPEDANAEVRDPDTGEVIFPARTTKLRLVPTPADEAQASGLAAGSHPGSSPQPREDQ
jgi:hypothetical protein